MGYIQLYLFVFFAFCFKVVSNVKVASSYIVRIDKVHLLLRNHAQYTSSFCATRQRIWFCVILCIFFSIFSLKVS